MELWRIRWKAATALTSWMQRIPLIGPLMRVFWSTLIEEGVTGVPDALAFSFMNDYLFDHIGKPTLWHTWYQLTHDNMAPYSGQYKLDPPPASLAEAIALQAKYEAKWASEKEVWC